MKRTTSDLIKEAFELSDIELKLFLLIWNSNKQQPIIELSKKIKRDRTTTQKIIKRLLEKDLIIYRQVNLSRGYRLEYSLLNKERLISKIEAIHKVKLNNYIKALKKIAEFKKIKLQNER